MLGDGGKLLRNGNRLVLASGPCCCEEEERTILPFLSNRLATGSELLFAVCDPTNGRDRRLVEEDFSDLDDWVTTGGATASGGTVQFPVSGSISMPRVLAVNVQFQALVLKVTAASDVASSGGGRVVLRTEDVGVNSLFDNHEASPTEANPWVAGSLIEIRLIAGTPDQFEYYLDGNLVSSSTLNSSGALGCVFISAQLVGDDTTSFSDFSLEVFGP